MLRQATSEQEFKWPVQHDGMVTEKPYPGKTTTGAPKYGQEGHAGGLTKSPFALELNQLPTRQFFVDVFDMLFKHAMQQDYRDF